MKRTKGDHHKHYPEEKQKRRCVHSDSDPELSSSELDSDECSLSWA